MTVDELRAALAGIPGDQQVWVQAEYQLTDDLAVTVQDGGSVLLSVDPD